MATTVLAASGNLSVVLVYLAGLLSFFSPCIIPLIPLYFGYLAGGAKTVNEDGSISYKRSTVLIHTFFFILGISAAFFLLGAAFTALGAALSAHKATMLRVGAILVIFFGIWMLLPNKSAAGQKEKRFKMPQFKSMNPLVALVMGFFFSFAWTPCVGPILSSVLIMAANATSAGVGYLLIGVYTLGFITPFILLGFFTGTLLNWLKKHSNALRWTVKAGGILLIVMGISMLTGWFNALTTPLSKFTGPDLGISQKLEEGLDNQDADKPAATKPANNNEPANNNTEPADADKPAAAPGADAGQQSQDENKAAEQPKKNTPPAPDFVLTDQYGNEHRLSDYKGKTVFLNFWATWCPPCQHEMPDIEAIYHEYGENKGDVIILGVANPSTPEQHNNDKTVEEVKAFLQAKGYTFPTMMDTTSQVFGAYRVTAFPTTFIINKEGNVEGYVPGAMPRATMKNIIEDARNK